MRAAARGAFDFRGRQWDTDQRGEPARGLLARPIPMVEVALTHEAVSAPRQLTLRAVVTGMVLGALLAPCNIYAGLKIGWAFNMSITAALLSYGFWNVAQRAAGTPRWGLLENNINQTAASAGASIASAGLVAPIPALAMLTGFQLPYWSLVVWVVSVSAVGVVVAVALRRQMLEVDALPFPAGVATAETLREIYAEGREALLRVRVLLVAGTVAAAVKLYSSLIHPIAQLPLVPGVKLHLGRAGKPLVASLRNLGFVFDPSLLMLGFGAIIGLRAATSLLVGAVLGWGVLAPIALHAGWAHAGHAGSAPWFGPVVEWLLWPGVALMVTASLTSFAFSWRSILAAFGVGSTERSASRGPSQPAADSSSSPAATPPLPRPASENVPRRWFVAGLAVATIGAVCTQIGFFNIIWWVAVLGVVLTLLLAVVAGRVSGETGITPIGAMGKVTQLTFGIISPGSPAANLMTANVTGGAAGQCADLLHDLKTGLLVRAAPRAQAVAQAFGIFAGALTGTAAYVLLVPHPATQLITPKWPAPAVAAWRAVAEVFEHGWHALPTASVPAMLIAGGVGIGLAVLERTLPKAYARWLPSAASVGLAFVIPAWNSISMFLGAALAAILARRFPAWSTRFVIVIAAGLVAGESLGGVGAAVAGVLGLH